MATGTGKSRFALVGPDKAKFNDAFQEAHALQSELERAKRAGLPVEEVAADHKAVLDKMKAFKTQYVD